jgi:hypothetical protein
MVLSMVLPMVLKTAKLDAEAAARAEQLGQFPDN